ncbi:uncharacterized protein LAJ45_04901 [Morchella importuna]|uniref:Cyanovirin-N domain-containing protein n=1 Tax=Morchella conica CCBAS932 TaxID=1392247 RepID=A0A3N4KBZ4_9PEZI|nr:uncharacterized protein LAJ45_04901 [Morchella importuna]KAH8151199.1 hypothetical protein LAJ45_04901 [Morchella importuna]RPB08026.1 hypothetical protein P167DRAFT_549297 [Morchella conica CCBAS932]
MQFFVITFAITLLTLTRAHPTAQAAHPHLLTPRAPTIQCRTTGSSPSIADLRSLGAINLFADGRGFCLTTGALCPGQFNNFCVEGGGVTETVLARKGNLVVTARGNKKNMQLLCGDLQRGIDDLRSRCEKDGKVEGSVQFEGKEGRGYVTVEVKNG